MWHAHLARDSRAGRPCHFGKACSMTYRKSLRLRLVWVLGLNATVGLCIAFSLWWLQSRGNLHSLPSHLADSAIHSVTYGTMFGLAMPYLAERFGALRFPWNGISIIT